jgi:hypothetical protein
MAKEMEIHIDLNDSIDTDHLDSDGMLEDEPQASDEGSPVHRGLPSLLDRSVMTRLVRGPVAMSILLISSVAPLLCQLPVYVILYATLYCGLLTAALLWTAKDWRTGGDLIWKHIRQRYLDTLVLDDACQLMGDAVTGTTAAVLGNVALYTVLPLSREERLQVLSSTLNIPLDRLRRVWIEPGGWQYLLTHKVPDEVPPLPLTDANSIDTPHARAPDDEQLMLTDREARRPSNPQESDAIAVDSDSAASSADDQPIPVGPLHISSLPSPPSQAAAAATATRGADSMGVVAMDQLVWNLLSQRMATYWQDSPLQRYLPMVRSAVDSGWCEAVGLSALCLFGWQISTSRSARRALYGAATGGATLLTLSLAVLGLGGGWAGRQLVDRTISGTGQLSRRSSNDAWRQISQYMRQNWKSILMSILLLYLRRRPREVSVRKNWRM